MDHYSGVYLSGNFNNWQRQPMKFCDNEYIESIGEKIFHVVQCHTFLMIIDVITLVSKSLYCVSDLMPGKYEFKFFVDGEWKHDPKLNNIANKLGMFITIPRSWVNLNFPQKF